MDVFVDFKSPAAYLAFNRTIALAESLGEAIDWYPVQTKQSSVPQEQQDEDRGATHRRVRAQARQDMHARYADVLGLPMIFRSEPGSTDLALVALETLTGNRTQFIQTAFNAYWTTEVDLNDHGHVQQLLTDTDCDANLSNPEAILDRIFKRAQEAGAIDAPAYVIHSELFIGREHLPWIESLIKSRATTHG